jgi:hypothetical protein
MQVRFVEIPEPTSEFGMFDRIPNEFGSAVNFAEELKIRTRRCYGAPIQAYLTQIVAQRDPVANKASEVVREFVRHTTSDSTPSEIVNVAQRFGLATAGGIIAIRHGILTWNENKYLEGQRALFQEWRQARGSDRPADEDRAVRQARELIESHGNRFVGISTIEPSASSKEDEVMKDESPAGGFATHDQLGFRKRIAINGVEETVYLVWPEKFKSVFCQGLDPDFVARTLYKRGHLYADRDHNPKVKNYQFTSKVPGFSTAKHFYTIRESILD